MKKILVVIPIIALIIFVLPTVLFFGNEIMVITSTSMLPTLQPNDLIVVRSATVSEVKVGDIIVFDSHFELGNIAHRAIEIKQDEHGIGIITKGDNIATEDGWIVYDESMIGVVDKSIPYVGVLLIGPVRYALIAIVVITSLVLLKESLSEKKE
ncbi:MAG: signal peptidase I [Nitrosopumilus sp.]|nr:signal peptidase I [Nitrosopumilus sp.]